MNKNYELVMYYLDKGFTADEIKKKAIFSLTYYKVIDKLAESYNKSLASHVYSDNPKIEGYNDDR